MGRVLDMSFAEVDRISKLVPKQLNIKLEKAIEDPELKDARRKRAARQGSSRCQP